MAARIQTRPMVLDSNSATSLVTSDTQRDIIRTAPSDEPHSRYALGRQRTGRHGPISARIQSQDFPNRLVVPEAGQGGTKILHYIRPPLDAFVMNRYISSTEVSIDYPGALQRRTTTNSGGQIMRRASGENGTVLRCCAFAGLAKRAEFRETFGCLLGRT